MNRGWGGNSLFLFRGDRSRVQKLENRWNCLNSLVQGCSYSLLEWQAVKLTFLHPVDKYTVTQIVILNSRQRYWGLLTSILPKATMECLSPAATLTTRWYSVNSYWWETKQWTNISTTTDNLKIITMKPVLYDKSSHLSPGEWPTDFLRYLGLVWMLLCHNLNLNHYNSSNVFELVQWRNHSFRKEEKPFLMISNNFIRIYVWEDFCNHASRNSINPFAPEPPITARADPGPFYPLWRHQF